MSIVLSEKTLSLSKSQKCPGSNKMSTTPLSSSTSLHKILVLFESSLMQLQNAY